MYINLLMASWDVQRKLASAYENSNRNPGIGMFLLCHLITSLRFVERTVPPEAFRELHDAWLAYQRLSVEILAAELEIEHIRPSKMDEYERVTQHMLATMNKLREAT